MMLRRGPREPAERGTPIARDAVAVEEQLAIGGLRVRMPRLGRRAQERRAALGRTRQARGDLLRGQLVESLGQKPTFSVPNTVRPAAMVA